LGIILTDKSKIAVVHKDYYNGKEITNEYTKSECYNISYTGYSGKLELSLHITNAQYKDKAYETLAVKYLLVGAKVYPLYNNEYRTCTALGYEANITANNLNDKEMYFSVNTEDNSNIVIAEESTMEQRTKIKNQRYYTSYKLKPIIATWYNALRRIALVGLLSVLVYVGIRIVLTSSSQDKAKYKNMLKDWLVALCLLFTLHYIMSATITIVNEISEIFGTGETDVLLNDLRTKIKTGSWDTVLAQTIMYVVIVIFTVMFTIQYLVRVIYMAFYTLIAPLITLTYPLDKIKDGQAQAFSMWIKEYIFTALVQVIHLVIYFVLISSAMELAVEYSLFAIIVMAFIKKAEGIIKKMFGFEKSDTVGTLGAAATGGLVMNAINKIGGKSSKGGKSGGDSDKGSTKNNVRTAGNNVPAAIPENQGASEGAASADIRTANAGGTEKNAWEKAGRVIRGTMKVGGKYIKPVAKATIGAGLGLTGAMIGFASGVAEGDVGKALTRVGLGGAAGSALGKGAVDAVAGMPGKLGEIKEGLSNLGETYREGYYGTEQYEAIRTIAQNCPDEIYNNDELLEQFWRNTMGEEEKAENIKEILRKFK